MKAGLRLEYYPGDTGQFIRVIPERCTGCGLGARYCARGVWVAGNGTYRPERLSDCAECGACWNVCPEQAVELGEPRGGTGVRFRYG